jgi:hypothetical protein
METMTKPTHETVTTEAEKRRLWSEMIAAEERMPLDEWHLKYGHLEPPAYDPEIDNPDHF